MFNYSHKVPLVSCSSWTILASSLVGLVDSHWIIAFIATPRIEKQNPAEIVVDW